MSDNTPTLWSKLQILFGSAVTEGKVIVGDLVKEGETLFSEGEQEFLTLAQPLFNAAESTAVTDLTGFMTTFIKTAEGAKSIQDWETAIMNELQSLGGDLFATAQGLGTNLVQALIGLVLQKLATVAVAAV